MDSEKKEIITTNDKGGKQSHIPARYDLLPPEAMEAVAEILHEGAQKYSDNNWRNISRRLHINHALNHIFQYARGDTSEQHLKHAATRLLFALSVPEEDYPYNKIPKGK